MADDVHNVIIRVQGAADVKRLTAELAAQERQLLVNIAVNGQHAASTQQIAQAIKQTSVALKAASNDATGFAKAGLLMNQVGFAADDLQSGFKGISNNIQPLLMNIPALAKFAGPISIAAIATYQLYNNWDRFMDLLGMGLPQPALTGLDAIASGLKKAQTEADELAKKARLTWYELARLNTLRGQVKDLEKAQKDARELEGVLGGQSEREKAVGSGVKAAIAESGGTNAVDELSSALGEKKDAKGLVFNAVTRTMTTPEQAAKDLALAASRGDELALREIKGALKPGSQFAAELDRQSPDTKAAQDRADAVADAEDEAFQDNLSKGEKRKQREAAEAQKVAAGILKGVGGDAFLLGKGDDSTIDAELARRGLRTDDPLLRARVRSQLTSQAAVMRADQASELGLADPAAGGASLVAERQRKRSDEAAKALKDRVDSAKEANPELAEAMRESIKGMVQVGGLSLDEAKSNIVGGLKAKLGEDVARSLTDAAGRDAIKALGHEAITERAKDLGPSQVIQGAAGLRDSLQGSVKGPEIDLLQRQLQETQRANELLRDIASQGGGLG